MRTVLTRAGLAAGLLLAASAAWAQPPAAKPAAKDEGPNVHQMEIFNGPYRTTHYIYRGDSPSEAATLRDLERSENEVAIADELQRLRLQYVRNERDFEQRRHDVQKLLYGYNSDYTASLYTTTGFSGGYGYPYWGGYWPNGYGYYGAYGFGSGASASNTLAVGVGDEGRIKTEIARTLAGQATPEYAAMAVRAHGVAVARVGESDNLRKGMGYAAAERPVAAGRDFVVLKNGERIEGTILAKEGDADFLVIDTGSHKEFVRKSEIERRGEAKQKSGVKPAADEKNKE
jgi:hypothetical protein